MSLYNVTGQNKISNILSTSLKYGRVSHAYIFAGHKGIGKLRMALEFAKALNCLESNDDACDNCQNCKRIEHFNHQDVILIKPDGNSIKIEQIRDLQKDFNYKAIGSKYKVFIIENAELMTNQAANSLLKFLEEPGSPSVAILLAESYYQLLPTIKSRCQTIYFSTIDPYNFVNILKDEGYKEGDILLASNLTQDIEEIRKLLQLEEFAQMRNIMIQWNEDLRNNNYQALFSINGNIMKNDYIKEHLSQFIDLLIIWYRDILNVKLNRKYLIIFKGYEEILLKQALYETEISIVNKIESFLLTRKKISSYVNPQLALEEMVLSLWEG